MFKKNIVQSTALAMQVTSILKKYSIGPVVMENESLEVGRISGKSMKILIKKHILENGGWKIT